MPVIIVISFVLISLLSLHMTGQYQRKSEMSEMERALRLLEHLDNSVELEKSEKEDIAIVYLESFRKIRQIKQSDRYGYVAKQYKISSIVRERDQHVDRILNAK